MPVGIPTSKEFVKETTTFGADTSYKQSVGETARLTLVWKASSTHPGSLDFTIKYGKRNSLDNVVYGNSETIAIGAASHEDTVELAASGIAVDDIQLTVPNTTVLDYLALVMI